MDPTNSRQDDLLYELGLALLELIDRPIDLELSQNRHANGLVLNGTLLRAFDSPAQADISLMIGSHTISIRPATLANIFITRAEPHKGPLQSIHILFTDNFFLHIKPQHPAT
jgi:hypothetical protein